MYDTPIVADIICQCHQAASLDVTEAAEVGSGPGAAAASDGVAKLGERSKCEAELREGGREGGGAEARSICCLLLPGLCSGASVFVLRCCPRAELHVVS